MKISYDDSSDVKFYFSFQCPYSFLAWKQICEIFKDNDKVTVKPINIGLNLQNNSSYSYREFWGKERWDRIIKEANNLGIVINKPLKFVSEDLAARCIQSYDIVSVEYYISSIFKAVFTSNLDISITSSLRYFLQSEGNDSEIIVEASKDSETLQKYQEQTELWRKNRIRVIPTVEVETDRVAGYITRRQFESLFRSLTD